MGIFDWLRITAPTGAVPERPEPYVELTETAGGKWRAIVHVPQRAFFGDRWIDRDLPVREFSDEYDSRDEALSAARQVIGEWEAAQVKRVEKVTVDGEPLDEGDSCGS